MFEFFLLLGIVPSPHPRHTRRQPATNFCFTSYQFTHTHSTGVTLFIAEHISPSRILFDAYTVGMEVVDSANTALALLVCQLFGSKYTVGMEVVDSANTALALLVCQLFGSKYTVGMEVVDSANTALALLVCQLFGSQYTVGMEVVDSANTALCFIGLPVVWG